MLLVVKAMQTASKHNVLLLCLNVLKIGIMTDTQAFDVVTFDFKGTRVRCFVSGSTEFLFGAKLFK